MNQTPVALRYSKALFQAAQEQDKLERIQQDAQGLLGVVQSSEDLRAFLANPLIRPGQKRSVFQDLFSEKVDALSLNFLLLLCDKRRERALEDILQGFLDILDDRMGVVTAVVRASTALSGEQQERLTQRLSAYSGKQVRLDVEVDENLKSGFVARLGDHVFDGTLEAQLDRLRRTLSLS
ncbi:MAG: ATP synthase F1 subunit delta [bacterium]|nr:ATP synthase F1 subunit delta [bacterium]